uniref:Kringle domain-containing protein n=1 Tax=Branchiostoma floridae TaxID=7739 RepID=C3ZVD6_BRAFL|eukprot:XP_002587446.1 hypothetical protein BRAFLDRAFT_100128 [Branchiostoma floridae]
MDTKRRFGQWAISLVATVIAVYVVKANPSLSPTDPTEPPAHPTKPSEYQTNLPTNPTLSPGDPTQPPADPTQPPADPTQPPADPTQPPADPTQPPAGPTQPPADPTQPPADPTQPPADPTHSPLEPTQPPTYPTLYLTYPNQSTILTDCQIGNGASYRGTISVTRTGKTCQHWDSQTPHEHGVTPANYPASGLEQNYCRNPDGDPSGVWCITTDSERPWDYCDVPTCSVKKGHHTRIMVPSAARAEPPVPGPSCPAPRARPIVPIWPAPGALLTPLTPKTFTANAHSSG